MTASPLFPKPVKAPKAPRKRLVARAPMRRSWMKKSGPRRLDRIDREVMVNDFDGRGPRIEIKQGADEAKLIWCRSQPCQRCGREPTKGRPSNACHESKKPGIGMKSPDQLAFPLCADCHRQWTDRQSTNGFARHWSTEKCRAWADEQAAVCTSRYLSSGSRRGS